VAISAQAKSARIGGTAKRVMLVMSSDPFRVSLVVLIVLTISRIHMQFPVLKAMRPALVMTILAAVFAYAKPALLSPRPLLETRNAKLIAGFAALACIGAPFGLSLGNSAVFILNDYVKTIVFAFLIIVAIRDTRDLRTIILAFVIGTGLLTYTSLFVFKVEQYKGYQRLANLDTYDANDLGLVLIVGLALTLLTFQTAKLVGKIVCAIMLIGIGAAISKSGSRGALIGLCALGLGLLLLLDRVPIWKRVLFVGVTGLALSAFAPPGYWQQMSTILNPKADYNWDSVNGRRKVAQRGIAYYKQYPVFGLGINNFQKAECSISDKAITHEANTGIRCTPPHNSYIQALSEEGTPGIVLWILMIPGSVVALVNLRRRLPRAWARGDAEERYLYLSSQYLAIGTLGFAFGSFFLTFAWTDVTYYLSAATAALYVAVGEKKRRVSAGAMAAPPLTAAQRRRARSLVAARMPSRMT
jgi:putative inorganic carbon (HCO3(-)) transporter